MAVQNFRYRATVKTKLGNEWLLDLRPGDSVAPSLREMRTDADGFTLSYKGEGEEFTKPIRGSELNFIMVVQNQADEDFVTSIAQSPDQSAVAQLYRYDGVSLYPSYWLGYVWADTIKISYGAFPYSVSISASDSVARFKDYVGYPFNGNRVWNYFQMVFANYNALGAIDQSGNISLSTAYMGASQLLRFASSYVSSASLPGETNLWYNLDTSFSGTQTEINTIENRLEVLTDWMRMWGFRCFLEEGYYKIIEFRYQATGDVDWANHDSFGVPDTTTTNEVLTKQNGFDFKILDGGMFFYKTPSGDSDLEYLATPPSTSKTVNSRNFGAATDSNVKTLDSDFGDIWSYKMGHDVGGVGPITDVTTQILNGTTSPQTSLVEIFQDNMESLYALPQKYFNGSVRGKDIKYSSVLVIGTDYYICNSATYIAAMDEWMGEWVKVNEDSESFWISQTSGDNIKNQNNDDNFKFQ